MSLPGRLIELPSGRVFVHTRAAGPRATPGALPLVLIHGYLLSHWCFAPVVERLAQARPLVLLDLPGHGESDRPSPQGFPYDLPALVGVVLAVLDALEVPRAALLGHSLGGAVALSAALRQPARCERLIICGGIGEAASSGLAQRMALLPLLGPALFRHALSKRLLRSLMVRLVYRDPALVTVERVDYYWERLCRAGGMEAMRACLHTLVDLSADPPPLAEVKAPVLVLWGEEDRAAPLWQGRRLQRALPDARLAVVPACGHNPFEERPAEFCRLLEPFLAGAETPGEGLLVTEGD